MRNVKFLSAILATMLVLSTLSPVCATSAETVDTTETTQSIEATTSASSTEDTTAPATEAPAVVGGSSVDSNDGIDAPRALADENDLDFDAAAVLLYEMSSGTMVYAKNIDGRREPASLTKVMTCLLALEHGTLTDVITVSEKALANIDPDGSAAGLEVGEQLTLEQLLYCLMVESANDAAGVIAEYISGSEEAFVELMNQKAKELGCNDTSFANTHGLHDDNHYTTARDLAKILMEALRYEKFQEIYSTDRYVLPATNLQEERILVTTNFLIGTAITWDYYDERVVGGKTGFTTPAGRCVMLTAKEDGLEYLCVVLGAENTVTDEATLYGSFITASKALDFGFDKFTFAEVLSHLAPVAQLPVADATESVVVTPAQEVTTMLPADYDESLLSTKYELSSPDGLKAPLKANETVGVVRKYYGDICVGETDLVTVTGVERRVVASAVNETLDNISDSPWRFVMIALGIILALLAALYIWSFYVRCRNRRRRRNRRNGR